MTSVNALVRDQVISTVECLDRIYLNGYIPTLQVPGQLVRLRLCRIFELKQCFKGGRALRTETTINDPKDFCVNKGIANLPYLQKIGRQINRRLLDVQRVSHNCHLSQENVERVV